MAKHPDPHELLSVQDRLVLSGSITNLDGAQELKLLTILLA